MTSHEPAPRKGSRSHTRDSASAVTWPVRVAASWSVRLLIVAAAVYVLLIVFKQVSLIAFALIVALLIASVLHPVEKQIRRLVRLPSLSALLTIVVFLAVFGLVGWFVVNQVQDHSSTLATQLSQVANNIGDYLKNGPLHVKDSDLDTYTKSITDAIKNNQSKLVSGALSTAATLIEALAGVLLTVFSLFFFLREGERIWTFVLVFVPARARPRTDYAGRRGWHTLGGYVRGQVFIAFLHAITIFILLEILRVPLAGALAALIFVGAFIPIIGIVVAGALATGVTLLEHGFGAAIAVAIAIIVLVQLESHVLQPAIMSRAVHIHPLAVVLAVAAGSTLYGIVGALIAVPLVAFVNSFVRASHAAPPHPDAEAERPDDPPPPPGPGEEQPKTPPPSGEAAPAS